MRALYEHYFEVYRNIEQYDEYNRPITDLKLVGDGVGRLSHIKAGSKQKSPNNEGFITDKLFTDVKNDIRAGDIIEIIGRRYIAEPPLPYREHQEIELVYRTDI